MHAGRQFICGRGAYRCAGGQFMRAGGQSALREVDASLASGSVDDEAIVRRGVRAGLPRLYKTAFLDERIRPHITLEAKGEAGSIYRVSLLNPLESPSPTWSFKTEFLADDSAEFVSRGVRGNKENLLDWALRAIFLCSATGMRTTNLPL